MDDLKPLYVIIQSLALIEPYLVLQHGTYYWRIERMADKSRRDRVSGTAQDKAILEEPAYWWEHDEDRKVVIRRREGQVAYAEPGSRHVPP
jgi:hypothetical protein